MIINGILTTTNNNNSYENNNNYYSCQWDRKKYNLFITTTRTCWGGSETKINTQVTRNYQNKTGKPQHGNTRQRD